MVLAEPIQLSEQQIEAFASLYPVNARPIQLNVYALSLSCLIAMAG